VSNITGKALRLLGLPVIAVVALMVVFSLGHSTPSAEAVNPAMSLGLTAGATTCPPAKDPGSVCGIVGQQVKLGVFVDKVPADGMIGIQVELDFAGLIAAGGSYQAKPTADEIVIDTNAVDGDWPGIAGRSPAAPTKADTPVNWAMTSGGTSLPPVFVPSFYTGVILEVNIACSTDKQQDIVIDLVPLDGGNTNASGIKSAGNVDTATSDTITLHCVNAPTATPLPPTNTPPDFPQMQKLCDSDGDTVADSAQCNLFLTRQGTKVPPLTCAAGDDTLTFSETLSIPIPDIQDPKEPEGVFSELGAFEFEIHFDDTKVCVNIVAGPAAADMICIIEDKDSSQLEGVARIGCVTQGKDNFPDTETPDGRHLADVVIRPQPDVYSQAKPNQDNGVVVQVNNVLCELADLQGHPLPVFSCEDADATIRYLEGDVEPDCEIDALDTQAIAFRWGVEKGSLIYTEFMNLEPSGAQADNDIDIKDLQFVFGRFGSSCDAPHPPQNPVNPKA
jgi:hypothetical protein